MSSNRYTCTVHKCPIYTLIKRIGGKTGPFVCLDCWRKAKPSQLTPRARRLRDAHLKARP